MKKPFIILDETDNVATALRDLSSGFEMVDPLIEGAIICKEDIPKGHKVAIKNLSKDEDAIKYGSVIGRMTEDTKVGYLVHVHNLVSKRGKERGQS